MLASELARQFDAKLGVEPAGGAASRRFGPAASFEKSVLVFPVGEGQRLAFRLARWSEDFDRLPRVELL